MKGYEMTKRSLIVLITMLTLTVPSVASAVEPPPAEPQRGASTPQFTCVPVKGNPELEHAVHETPPPEGPNGEALPPKPTNVASACPKGTLGVTKAQNRPRKQGRPFVGGALTASPFAAPCTACSASGYYYVGDAWIEEKAIALTHYTEFSSPTVPTNARPSAHTVSQLALRGGANGQYTIEMGWTKELSDQENGYKGATVFFYVNPDNYGPRSCYDCGLILAAGVTRPTPFETHYKPTDGSPESESKTGEKPATYYENFQVRQYKGAWWLWFANAWIGRVSNEAWGKHFTKGNEELAYGEVFDWSSSEGGPLTPMGNGNKGGCLCATGMQAPAIGLKPLKSSEPPHFIVSHFSEPLAEVSWPQRYTAGNINANRTELHFGG